mmetsp:Transcript_4967/g.16679  ORF Transcript_4967/g.16679 Transcript_4967/m.16679 type:complete len:201 (-) Transcript_4967:920-1522(-)
MEARQLALHDLHCHGHRHVLRSVPAPHAARAGDLQLQPRAARRWLRVHRVGQHQLRRRAVQVLGGGRGPDGALPVGRALLLRVQRRLPRLLLRGHHAVQVQDEGGPAPALHGPRRHHRHQPQRPQHSQAVQQALRELQAREGVLAPGAPGAQVLDRRGRVALPLQPLLPAVLHPARALRVLRSAGAARAVPVVRGEAKGD